MDIPGLGVVDLEGLIAAVGIGMMKKVAVKGEDVVHEVQREYLDILLALFSAFKFFPGLQEVFNINYFFKTMGQLDFHKTPSFSTPPQLIPLLHKAKELYLLWYTYYKIMPKEHRYSLGRRVDTSLVEIIETITIASFLKREEKLPYVRIAIRKIDTLKIFLMILWETKSLNNSKYTQLSEIVSEIGRMLGGWNGQISKQNSSDK